MSRIATIGLGLLGALLVAHAAARGVQAEVSGKPTDTLPEDWDTMSAHHFQSAVEARPAIVLEQEQRDALAAALDDASAETAMRAAVLLARADARGILLAHLERRLAHEKRNADAADVVCAGALAHPAEGESEDVRTRLASLAAGASHHPDLEVRVECARGALFHGDRTCVPFLLALLRAETPDREPELEDWPKTDTLAWAKGRAAEALSEVAGVPCTFRADGPYARQAKAAAELEEALR